MDGDREIEIFTINQTERRCFHFVTPRLMSTMLETLDFGKMSLKYSEVSK